MKTHFKKMLFMAVLCLGLSNCLYAQQEVDTTFYTQVNAVFGNLDKSRVPFGLLNDFAFQFTNLQNYNGINIADSTLINKSIFYDIYKTLFTAAVTPAALSTMPNPATVDSLWFSKRQPGQIALCGLFYQYAYLDVNALNNGAITVSNNQYFDSFNGGVWQNPYLTAKAVGFAPATEVYLGQSFNILLSDSLWLSNSKNMVDHIAIDPADGQGYRTLTPNTPLPVTYADTGLKVWNFKLYLINGSVLQSQTRLQVNADIYGQNIIANFPQGSTGNRQVSTQGVTQGPPTNGASSASAFYYVTSTETYNGIPAKGYITVQYAAGHTSIQKPLIVVEGFDYGYYTTPEIPTGNSTLQNFNNSVIDSKSSQLEALLQGPAAQYDIVYIDYANGTDDLHRNALLVKEVIRWVNSVKTPLNGVMQQNVVLGLSMGGVISRYALKAMENNGENHDTRLYINHDGPQQGANVPVGYQNLVNHARYLYFKAGVAASFFTILNLITTGSSNNTTGELDLKNTPAAQQMLIDYIDDNDNLNTSVHDAWQTELTNLGYPTNCTNVAISNGSECAQSQVIQPGGQLFLLDGQMSTSFLGSLISSVPGVGVFATIATGQPAFLLSNLPGSSKIKMHFQVNASNTTGGGNQVYNGHISYTLKFLWLLPITVTVTDRTRNAPGGIFGYDSFPGGVQDINALKNLGTSGNLVSYNINFSGPVDFCFIPVTSALDISTNARYLNQYDYVTPYSEATPPPAPKSTPFANFITAFNSLTHGNNEQHISYETRNGNWLANELQAPSSTPQSNLLSACEVFCSPQLINGPSFACNGSPQTYSVPANNFVTSYIWSSTPDLQIISGQGTNSVQVQSTSTTIGQGTLSVTYSNPDCGSATITTQINYGVPDCQTLVGSYHYFGGGGSLNSELVFSVPSQAFCTYQWYVNGAADTQDANGAEIIIKNPSCSINRWNIAVNVSNPCGAKAISRTFLLNCSGYPSLTTSGNPSCFDPNQYSSNSIAFGNTGTDQMAFYPNPANKTVTITTRSNPNAVTEVQVPFSYKLYDRLGKVLRSGQSSGDDAVIPTDNLVPDAYFLHVTVGDKQYQKQVIIQH